MELSKEYWTLERNHFIPKVMGRKIRKCAPFNTTKRKSYLCLNERLEILSYKGDNLLNKSSKFINDCRHQNKFTESYIFTEIFPAVVPLRPPFWFARLMFSIMWFSNPKSSSSKRRFH